MNISRLVQKLIYYLNERSSIETIYLISKFLDTSTSNYQLKQRFRLCYPLKYYADSYSLVYDEQNIIGNILNRVRKCYGEEILTSDCFTEFQDPTKAYCFSVLLLKQYQVILNTPKLSQTGMKDCSEICLAVGIQIKIFFSTVLYQN